MMHFNLTVKSRNEKTGPIPVSTSSAKTCPDTCPLKKAGCYGDGGPLALFWAKVTRGEAGKGWIEFCADVSKIPDGSLWRHNQVGDLPPKAEAPETIDRAALALLVSANKGKRGFTFSHFDTIANAENRETIRAANAAGFTVNLSANTLDHADALAETGAGPVATVLPADLGRKTKGKQWAETLQEYNARISKPRTPAGRAVSICPATFLDTNCKACGLCAKADRKAIVGFPAHGVSTKKADLIARG
jgi:hypothetical protein